MPAQLTNGHASFVESGAHRERYFKLKVSSGGSSVF
jgi:hypothetical protein